MPVWIATETALYDLDRGRWMLWDYGHWRPATPAEAAERPAPDVASGLAHPGFRFAWISDHRLGWTLLDADGYRVEPT
jgi:hypothetical protein